MFAHETILHRLRHGCQTMTYPDGPPPALPDRHGGALRVDAMKCAADCDACVPVCPTQAITREPAVARASRPCVSDSDPDVQIETHGRAARATGAAGIPVALDLGRCLFCVACVEACPTRAITQTGDYRMAARRREDLVLGKSGAEQVRLAAALDEKLRQL